MRGWLPTSWPRAALGRVLGAAGLLGALLLVMVAAFGVGLLVDRVLLPGRAGSDAEPRAAVRDRASAVPSATPTAQVGAARSSRTPTATRTPRPSRTPIPTRTARPSPTPTPTPAPASLVVTDLVVCDRSVDCGEDAASLGRGTVTACLRVTAGGSGSGSGSGERRPLVLVITERAEPPTGTSGPSVVGRSEPLPQDGGFRCHTVTAAAGALAPGVYWLWVLEGSAVAATTRFTIEPGRP